MPAHPMWSAILAGLLLSLSLALALARATTPITAQGVRQQQHFAINDTLSTNGWPKTIKFAVDYYPWV